MALSDSPENRMLTPVTRLLKRDENGQPVPVLHPVETKESIHRSHLAIASLMYEGDLDPETGEYVNFDPRFMGMTKFQVSLYRLMETAQRGDKGAIEYFADRILGKPKQAVENLSLSMSYEDYLQQLEDPTATATGEEDFNMYPDAISEQDLYDAF